MIRRRNSGDEQRRRLERDGDVHAKIRLLHDRVRRGEGFSVEAFVTTLPYEAQVAFVTPGSYWESPEPDRTRPPTDPRAFYFSRYTPVHGVVWRKFTYVPQVFIRRDGAVILHGHRYDRARDRWDPNIDTWNASTEGIPFWADEHDRLESFERYREYVERTGEDPLGEFRRQNPGDEHLRDLERRASEGDPVARGQLYRERRRRGIPRPERAFAKRVLRTAHEAQRPVRFEVRLRGEVPSHEWAQVVTSTVNAGNITYSHDARDPNTQDSIAHIVVPADAAATVVDLLERDPDVVTYRTRRVDA